MEEGFVRIDDDSSRNLSDTIETMIEDFTRDDLNQPNIDVLGVYQRGREYVFNLAVDVDYYDLELDSNYDDYYWDMDDIFSKQQRLQSNLQSIEIIVVPEYLERFYVREVKVKTKVWPVNVGGQYFTINCSFIVTIRGELIDFASLTQKSAQGF